MLSGVRPVLSLWCCHRGDAQGIATASTARSTTTHVDDDNTKVNDDNDDYREREDRTVLERVQSDEQRKRGKRGHRDKLGGSILVYLNVSNLSFEIPPITFNCQVNVKR